MKKEQNRRAPINKRHGCYPSLLMHYLLTVFIDLAGQLSSLQICFSRMLLMFFSFLCVFALSQKVSYQLRLSLILQNLCVLRTSIYFPSTFWVYFLYLNEIQSAVLRGCLSHWKDFIVICRCVWQWYDLWSPWKLQLARHTCPPDSYRYLSYTTAWVRGLQGNAFLHNG